MMKLRRHLAVGWYTALAMAAVLVLGTPRTGRAGQVTVSEILPTTGFRVAYALGPKVSSEDLPGETFDLNTTLTTPDGHFKIIINNIRASNPNGFPGLSGQIVVDNVTGGAGSIFMDVEQNYSTNVALRAGCIDGAVLTGTFTETRIEGNNVIGQGFDGGAPLPTLAAADTSPTGTAFNLFTGFFLLPDPVSWDAQVTFNFAADSQAGDLITIPYTILPAQAAIPEPASWVMISTAAMTGLGYWSYRRRRAAT
jgi:hypothetical protein